jgi:hypothetical protein
MLRLLHITAENKAGLDSLHARRARRLISAQTAPAATRVGVAHLRVIGDRTGPRSRAPASIHFAARGRTLASRVSTALQIPDERYSNSSTESKIINSLDVKMESTSSEWMEDGKIGLETSIRAEVRRDGILVHSKHLASYSEESFRQGRDGNPHTRIWFRYTGDGTVDGTVDQKAELATAELAWTTDARLALLSGSLSQYPHFTSRSTKLLTFTTHGSEISVSGFPDYADVRATSGDFDLVDLTFDESGPAVPMNAVDIGLISDATGALLEEPAQGAYRRAQRHWYNGHCIEVAVLEGEGQSAPPGSTVTIRAETRHRDDEGAEELPIEPTVLGGTISPSGPTASVATWQLRVERRSPDVRLLSMSERGVGHNNVYFGADSVTVEVSILLEYHPGLQFKVFASLPAPFDMTTGSTGAQEVPMEVEAVSDDMGREPGCTYSHSTPRAGTAALRRAIVTQRPGPTGPEIQQIELHVEVGNVEMTWRESCPNPPDPPDVVEMPSTAMFQGGLQLALARYIIRPAVVRIILTKEDLGTTFSARKSISGSYRDPSGEASIRAQLDVRFNRR